MNANFTIFVNSTDSYEDCWIPFFQLFDKYWPNCNTPIYLNTETKCYLHPALKIKSTRVGIDKKNITWSECLLNALDQIDSDIILYLQEDYFINKRVDSKTIDDLVKLMINEKLSCIQLTPYASDGPYQKTKYYLIEEIDRSAEYRISLQAALWNKHKLIKYLRKHENPWHFEIYGSKRLKLLKDKIYIVNSQYLVKNDIISYKPTGIIKGKWNRTAVEDLFQENRITVDFSLRGFYDKKKAEYKRVITLPKIFNRMKSLF